MFIATPLLSASNCNKEICPGLGRVGVDRVERVAQLAAAVRHGAQAAVRAHVRVAARGGVARVAGAPARLQPALALQAGRLRRRQEALRRVGEGQQEGTSLSYSVLDLSA